MFGCLPFVDKPTNFLDSPETQRAALTRSTFGAAEESAFPSTALSLTRSSLRQMLRSGQCRQMAQVDRNACASLSQLHNGTNLRIASKLELRGELCGAAVRICWNLIFHEKSFKTLISMCKLLRSLRSWFHSYINAKVCAILHLDSRFNCITFCLPWKHCHIGNANMARASKVMSWPNFPVSPVRQAVLPMKTLEMIPCPMRWPPVISCKLK